MPRPVLLLVNAEKPDARAAAVEVRALIERHGRLVASLDATNAPLPPEAREARLVVVIGGDGTFLSQRRRCAGLDAALLGVNAGRLGFMTEFDSASVRAQAPALFGDAPLSVQEFPLLRAAVYPSGSTSSRFEGSALNEAVITAGPPYGMIQLSLSIDGHDGPTVSGDGLIVSTPAGSTAYNLSAGGPIIQPGAGAVVITPIAPHTLSFRPIVVAQTSRIEVLAIRVNEAGPADGTTLLLDGQDRLLLRTGDRVALSAGGSARVVRNAQSDYWSRLTGKLGWAARPRMRE